MPEAKMVVDRLDREIELLATFSSERLEVEIQH